MISASIGLIATPALFSEQIHDVRIIPTDGRPHIPQEVRQLLGDPRGHWEGNTLVVETTNFTGRTSFRASGEHMHLTERFTRTGISTMLYEFTVDDPETFTQLWTARIPMTTAQGPLSFRSYRWLGPTLSAIVSALRVVGLHCEKCRDCRK